MSGSMSVGMSGNMSGSELVGYTHEFLSEFIQLYRSYPCLWQVRCKGYKDRLLRNRAYDALVQKLRAVNPIADRETVIRKINTLRTAFRREYKKVRSSQRMVPNPQHRYRSSLWYYDILKFVAEQNEEPAKCEATSEDQKNFKDGLLTIEACHEDMSIQSDVVKIEPTSPRPSSAFQPVILETEGSYTRRFSTPTVPESAKRKAQHDPTTQQPENPNAAEDDHETFGRYVAGKLRKSTQRQSMIAEKIIADVLLRANLGSLEEGTCLTEKIPSRCFLVMGDR